MQIKKSLLQTISAIGIAALASAASAATTTYNFGSFLTGSGPTTPASFATLTIDASADNKTFVFDLKVGSNLQSIFGSGAFISALQVNTYSNQDPASTTIAAGSWGVGAVKFSGNAANQGGVNWDYKDSFCGVSGGCNANAAGSRLTQGEEVKWTSVFSNAQTTLLANPGMLLKVQGYTWGGQSASADYTSVVSSVPEPETYAMLLAGMGLVAGVARRRKHKATAL